MQENVIDAEFGEKINQGPIESPIVNAGINHLANACAYWLKLLNARLLAIVALFGALIVFSFAMYDPSGLRLGGVSLYAVGVLWPTMLLFLKKG